MANTDDTIKNTAKVNADTGKGLRVDEKVNQDNLTTNVSGAGADSVSFSSKKPTGKTRAELRALDGLAKKTGLSVQSLAIIGGAVVIVIVLIITLAVTFSGGNFTKNEIVSLNVYPTRTAKDISDNVVTAKDTYKKGEPILGEWKFRKVADGETKVFSWRVVSVDDLDEEGQPKSVRNGTIPITGAEGDAEEGGVRYVSVVSSARNALAAGKYICEIKVSSEADSTNAELVARHAFTVTDDAE